MIQRLTAALVLFLYTNLCFRQCQALPQLTDVTMGSHNTTVMGNSENIIRSFDTVQLHPGVKSYLIHTSDLVELLDRQRQVVNVDIFLKGADYQPGTQWKAIHFNAKSLVIDVRLTVYCYPRGTGELEGPITLGMLEDIFERGLRLFDEYYDPASGCYKETRTYVYESRPGEQKKGPVAYILLQGREPGLLGNGVNGTSTVLRLQNITEIA